MDDPTGESSKMMLAGIAKLEGDARKHEYRAQLARDTAEKLRVVLGLMRKATAAWDAEYGRAVCDDKLGEYGHFEIETKE